MISRLKTLLAIGSAGVLSIALIRCFLVVNTTASLPPGIYHRTFEEPKRGSIVLVSPPARQIFKAALAKGILSPGNTEAGTCPLIKIMAAADGDEIEIQENGMWVNDAPLSNSQRQNWEISGMVALPIKKKLEGEVLLYTPHPQSFDSRYFGPIPADSILATLKPIFLWKTS